MNHVVNATIYTMIMYYVDHTHFKLVPLKCNSLLANWFNDSQLTLLSPL